MEELHYEIETGPGDIIQVHLSGNAANVLIMDDLSYQNYKQGLPYDYYGGYYTKTPVRIKPKVYGPLNVVVNLGGLPGSVNVIVQIVHPRRIRRLHR